MLAIAANPSSIWSLRSGESGLMVIILSNERLKCGTAGMIRPERSELTVLSADASADGQGGWGAGLA